MKPTLLTLLLVLSFSNLAQEPNPAIKNYHQQLTDHLRNHYDPNIQLKAYLWPFKTVNHEKIKLTLSPIINLSSDKFSIFLADNVCHSIVEITDWCHGKDIHDIRQQIDPKNLNSYLYELSDFDNDFEINELLETAADKSNYADSFFFHYIKETVNQIDIFNQQNENLYNAYISYDRTKDEDFLDELLEDINNSYLFSKEFNLEDLNLEISKSDSVITLIGIMMAYSTPSMRHLTDSCKKAENSEACLDLSQLLISSKTLLYQTIGFHLKIEALKTLNKDIRLIQKAELKKQQFSDAHICYSQTTDLTLATYFNLDFTDQYFNDLATFGEFTAWKNLALKVHENQVNNGLVSDFDPNNCEI